MKNDIFMNFVFDQQITSFYLAIGVNLRIYQENGKFQIGYAIGLNRKHATSQFVLFAYALHFLIAFQE